MIKSEPIAGYSPAPSIEQQTAAYKLFHYRFLCEVAQMHLYEANWLDISGFNTTGNPTLDRQMAIQPVVVQLTPAAMAKFHDEGVEMRLVNPEDSVKIYQLIFDHLNDWQNAVNLDINRMNGPLDDLKKFDRLASEVYKLARYYWKDQPYHGRFAQFVRGRGARRPGLELQSTAAQNQPEHTPMADAVAQGLKERSRPWKAG